MLKFPIPGATFVVPMSPIRLLLVSRELQKELADVLPVTADAAHVAAK
jgi:hypothetical protein